MQARDCQCKSHAPIEVGRLDVAKPLWFTRADQKHVGGDELVALQTYDVANHDVLPFLVCEGAVGLENLCEARVELGIGLVSFLLRE